MTVQPLKDFRSKNELVYDAIHSSILQGELEPGSRLVIDELATSLGVSHIPVREALRQLEGDGFVVIEPYVGATVTEICTSTICEIFELLGALTGISGRAACKLASEGDLQGLEQLLRRMDALINDPERWSQENIRFHLLICDHAQAPLVKSMLGKAFDHWDRLRHNFIKDVFVHRVEASQQEHWQMLEALQDKDVDRFEQIAHRHNQVALDAYVNYLESEGYITPSSDNGRRC